MFTLAVIKTSLYYLSDKSTLTTFLNVSRSTYQNRPYSRNHFCFRLYYLRHFLQVQFRCLSYLCKSSAAFASCVTENRKACLRARLNSRTLRSVHVVWLVGWFCLFNVLLNTDAFLYAPGHARFSFSKAKSAVPTVSPTVPRACCEQRPHWSMPGVSER